LFPELLDKIFEYPTPSAREFTRNFKATRARLIRQTIEEPTELKIWLYENQGVRRFDAANRFFLILVDLDNLEDSWKLKRNKKLLIDTIHAHLDTMRPDDIETLKISFRWQGSSYETYSDILFTLDFAQPALTPDASPRLASDGHSALVVGCRGRLPHSRGAGEPHPIGHNTILRVRRSRARYQRGLFPLFLARRQGAAAPAAGGRCGAELYHLPGSVTTSGKVVGGKM
jgi:hypothetical protein